MGSEIVPISEKYNLTIKEASMYFNIGETKLRRIISENQGSGFILLNGSKFLIKRKEFEKIVDSLSTI